jgi:hypothetical protein
MNRKWLYAVVGGVPNYHRASAGGAGAINLLCSEADASLVDRPITGRLAPLGGGSCRPSTVRRSASGRWPLSRTTPLLHPATQRRSGRGALVRASLLHSAAQRRSGRGALVRTSLLHPATQRRIGRGGWSDPAGSWPAGMFGARGPQGTCRARRSSGREAVRPTAGAQCYAGSWLGRSGPDRRSRLRLRRRRPGGSSRSGPSEHRPGGLAARLTPGPWPPRRG